MVGEYVYEDGRPDPSHAYLAPQLLRLLNETGARRAFEIGCGNGSMAARVADTGVEVVGVDISTSGVEQAKKAYPRIKIFRGSAYDALSSVYGRFPVVYSVEVIEHLYSPHRFVATCHDLLEPGGTLVLSTPYHGYVKNLALSVFDKWDDHFTSLAEHHHIKFFSPRTLTKLLTASGFVGVRISRVGRIPPLAKSMFAVARKA